MWHVKGSGMEVGMLFAFVWCWKGDESLFGRLGGAGSYWLVEGRVIFKETLKARLVHRGGMCYEVLTSGVQFFSPERPGVTLDSFVLG